MTTAREQYDAWHRDTLGYLDRMKGYDAGWTAAIDWFEKAIYADDEDFKELAEVIADARATKVAVAQPE